MGNWIPYKHLHPTYGVKIKSEELLRIVRKGMCPSSQHTGGLSLHGC